MNVNKCPVCKSQYVNVELFSRVSFLEERVGRRFARGIAQVSCSLPLLTFRVRFRVETCLSHFYAFMQLKRAHWCRAVYFILKAPAVDAASRPGDEKVLAINLTRETRESASNISESDDDFTVDHRTPEDIIVARDDQRNEGITISHFTGVLLGGAASSLHP